MSFNGDLYPTAGADVVMTTSGDMVKYESGARARLGIGSANQILQVKSSLPSWETLSTAGSVLTTQGDILYEGAAGLARLGQSTDGFVLTTKGASANPVWAAAGGGAVELLDYENFSANANSYTKTFSPALTYDDYGQFMIAISGKADATAASPYIIFSGSASNVYSTGNYNNRTTIAEEVVNGVAPMLLFNATGFGLGNESITSLITFTLNEPANYLTGRMETLNVSTLHSIWNLFEVSASDLSSIEIGMTSTGEFVANTKISMWGIKNA